MEYEFDKFQKAAQVIYDELLKVFDGSITESVEVSVSHGLVTMRSKTTGLYHISAPKETITGAGVDIDDDHIRVNEPRLGSWKLSCDGESDKRQKTLSDMGFEPAYENDDPRTEICKGLDMKVYYKNTLDIVKYYIDVYYLEDSYHVRATKHDNIPVDFPMTVELANAIEVEMNMLKEKSTKEEN